MRSESLIGLTSALLFCCAASLPSPNPTHLSAARAQDPSATSEDLSRGRSLYVAKCGSCHTLIHPVRFAAERWGQEVQEMQANQGVKLDAFEVRAIVLYLGAVSSVPQR